MAFGTGIVILLTWGLQSLGISAGPLPTALIALPLGIALTALLVLGTDRAVYKFYRRQKAAPIIFVMASVGVMYIYNALTHFLIGPEDRRFEDGERFVIRVNDFKAMTGLDQGLAQVAVVIGLAVGHYMPSPK